MVVVERCVLIKNVKVIARYKCYVYVNCFDRANTQNSNYNQTGAFVPERLSTSAFDELNNEKKEQILLYNCDSRYAINIFSHLRPLRMYLVFS